MEGSRRKSKLTTINNDFVNEELSIQIVSSDSDEVRFQVSSTNTPKKKGRPPKTPQRSSSHPEVEMENRQIDAGKLRKKLVKQMISKFPTSDSDTSNSSKSNKPQTPQKRKTKIDLVERNAISSYVQALQDSYPIPGNPPPKRIEQVPFVEVEHIQIQNSPKKSRCRTRSTASEHSEIAVSDVDPLLITENDLVQADFKDLESLKELTIDLLSSANISASSSPICTRKSKKFVIDSDSQEFDSDSEVPVNLKQKEDLLLKVITKNSGEDLSEFLKAPKVVLEDVLKSPTKLRKISRNDGNSVRKSGRSKKLSLKALETVKSPSKNWRKKKEIESSSEDEVNEIEKPTELLENNRIEGKQIFGFRTPKKRNALLETAKAVANSPMNLLRAHTEKLALTPRTPKSKKVEFPKTPAGVRSKTRKSIAKAVQETEDWSDYSASNSEYEPTESSTSSSEESQDDSDTPQSAVIRKIPVTVKTPRSRKEITYSLKSDDYFTTHSSKLYTSDNTLDKLKNPRLTQDKINDILQNVEINKEHTIKIQRNLNDYRSYFEKWMFFLHSGNFNILLFGLGSKKQILEDFHDFLLEKTKWPIVVVNGYFPSLVIKDIIDAIAIDLLKLEDITGNIVETVNDIQDFFENNTDLRLVIIVNNIDGEMLRDRKSQNVLSKLAAIRGIHMVASIDDINAPLIWDHRKLNRYNFTWWDVTTFLPYSEETSFEGSLLVQRSGTLTLSALKNIFQSLTTNARGIFTLIVKHHMDNKNDVHYQGILFKDLYWTCREAFLVSSDIALRAQLTEFLDHKLIKTKRSLDGAELLHIPIDHSLLQHFLDED